MFHSYILYTFTENKYNHSISEVQPPTTSTTTTTTETTPTTTTTRLHHRVTLGADRKGKIRVIILALLNEFNY